MDVLIDCHYRLSKSDNISLFTEQNKSTHMYRILDNIITQYFSLIQTADQQIEVESDCLNSLAFSSINSRPSLVPNENDDYRKIEEEFLKLNNEYKRPYIFKCPQIKDIHICVKSPSSATLMDYWHMIWTHQVGTIVLVSHDASSKAQSYWPALKDDKLELENGYSIQNVGNLKFGDHYQRSILIMTHKETTRVYL